MNFDAFVEEIKQNGWAVYGVEVYKDGKLLYEYGDTIGRRYPIYSATKAITSIAVGMAADEGNLDIHKPVITYLPEEVTKKMSKEQKELYQRISVKRLLTMSVKGYPFRPEGESWLKTSLAIPLPDADRKVFDYSNISAYLAGVVAACAVGEDLYAYLKRKLFNPLGIDNPLCGRCPDGYFYGASSMELTVRELSKIGLLLGNGGVYEGVRILSENYVKEATSIQQMNREGGYGYFIWKYRDGFSVNGKWGQKCYVLPSGIMVTYLSHIEDNSNELKASMERLLLDC